MAPNKTNKKTSVTYPKAGYRRSNFRYGVNASSWLTFDLSDNDSVPSMPFDKKK